MDTEKQPNDEEIKDTTEAGNTELSDEELENVAGGGAGGGSSGTSTSSG